MYKFIAAVQNISGSSFIGLDIETIPKIRKTQDTPTGRIPNPDFDRITKVNTGLSGMVFGNKETNAYENMVKRRLEKEGISAKNFKLSPRTWGSRIPETPLVEHKGQLYLDAIILNAGKVQYYRDGKPVDKSEIIGLSESKKPTQGGLEDSVIIRTIKIESLRTLRINGDVI